MHLLNYRITHNSAKIVELENTRFKSADEFYEIFSINRNIKEKLMLQTCNRNEFYFIVEDLPKAILQINQVIKMPEKFEIDTGLSVLNHLFHVASGINSLVIGEDQILGQIKEAFEIAQKKKVIGPVLTHSFQKALSIGKKIRYKTKINKGTVSIGSIAVDFCKNIFGDLQNRVITVIGAGEIATLVAKSLLKCNAKTFFVSNRTYERAERLAKDLGGKALRLDQLEEALSVSNIIILATSAPHPILRRSRIEEIMKNHNEKELVIIDISVPRNIEKGIEISNLKIYDLDGIKAISEENRLKRLKAIEKAEKIIEGAMEIEEQYFRQQFIKPLIASIYTNAEKIRRNEIEKLLKMMKNMSPEDIQNIDKFSQVLINKIFADFSTSIKSAPANSHFSPISI